jgi:predicted lipoprotein with Yx(FWY)xxD motif
VTVTAGETELGVTLTDPSARTLYAFTKDKDGTSSCYDDCSATWPALTVEEAAAGSGVEGSWLDSTERRDGTTQVTYKGMPLYYYAGDAGPGQTNGHGIGGVWFMWHT